MFSKSLSSFLVFSVFTSRPRSQLSHGGALITSVLPSRVFIFSTVPHYILCMLVPYLFELPPRFLCSPFWPHPALGRSVWGMAHTRPKSHRLWHVASSLDSSCAGSALGPSRSLCLGSCAFQVMPSGFVSQLLSSPMASPCLCPCKYDPWSCGWSLSPTLSLYLASLSGSLQFCCLDFVTSISKSLCFLLPLGVPDCAAQRCFLRSSAFHVSASVLLLLRKAVFLAELFPLFKYFCCFCFWNNENLCFSICYTNFPGDQILLKGLSPDSFDSVRQLQNSQKFHKWALELCTSVFSFSALMHFEFISFFSGWGKFFNSVDSGSLVRTNPLHHKPQSHLHGIQNHLQNWPCSCQLKHFLSWCLPFQFPQSSLPSLGASFHLAGPSS